MPDEETDAYIPIDVAQVYFGDLTMKRTAGAHVRELVELHQLIVQAENLETAPYSQWKYNQ